MLNRDAKISKDVTVNRLSPEQQALELVKVIAPSDAFLSMYAKDLIYAVSLALMELEDKGGVRFCEVSVKNKLFMLSLLKLIANKRLSDNIKQLLRDYLEKIGVDKNMILTAEAELLGGGSFDLAHRLPREACNLHSKIILSVLG